MQNFKEWLNFQLVEGTAVDLPDLVNKYLQGGYPLDAFIKNIRDSFTVRKDSYDLWKKSLNTPEFNQWRVWYNNAKEALIKHLESQGWQSNANPAWLGFNAPNQNNQKTKQDGKTFKRYYTVELKDLGNFISNLPSLAKLLGQIQTNNTLSFKIPNSYGGAMTERDSLVVHFYDKQIDSQVNQMVLQYFKQIGVQPTDRKQKFQDTAPNSGVDIEGKNGGSDTDILAQRFARNIDANKQVLIQMSKTNPNQFSQQLQTIWTTLNQQGNHRS